jgi:hypothetical protein
MDEDELGWIGKLRPFGTADAAQLEAQVGRCASLGQALWGRTAEDLRRQLQKSSPDVPPGFDLADFQLLQRESSRFASMNLDDPRNAWARPMLAFPKSIQVGTQRFTEWEARAEIIRRAIGHLGRN